MLINTIKALVNTIKALINACLDSAQILFDSAQIPFDNAQVLFDNAQIPFDSAQIPFDYLDISALVPDNTSQYGDFMTSVSYCIFLLRKRVIKRGYSPVETRKVSKNITLCCDGIM